MLFSWLNPGMQLPRPHPNKLKFIFFVATLALVVYVLLPRDAISFKLIHSKETFPSRVWRKQEHRYYEVPSGAIDVSDKAVTTEQDFAKRYTDAGDTLINDRAKKNFAEPTEQHEKIAVTEKQKGEKSKKHEKNKKTTLEYQEEPEPMKNMANNTNTNISLNTEYNEEEQMKTEPKNVDPYRIKSLLQMFKEDDSHNISDLEELKSKHILCTINRYKGHLGNRLFMFASGYGIAKANNMTFIIAQNIILRAYFRLTIPFVKESRPGASFPQHVHGGDGKFDKKLFHLKPQHTELSGYLQSFKYFHRYRDELMKELAFVQPTLDYVKDFLSPIRKTCPGGCTLVGVQIRRGNILTQQNKDDGYRAANVSFFIKAMDHFSKKYKNVKFIICTNEQGWVKQNFANETHTFYLSGYRNPEDRDLAVLANCDHTITASSTYGWWGAYLAGGDVVYYNGHPKPGSKLAKLYNLEDFYFDNWTPMSD